MTPESILAFKTLAPLLLPELIDLNHLESIDDYDDYALLAFNLAKPTPIESILDQFEDQMELSVLYHVIMGNASLGEQGTVKSEKGDKSEQGVHNISFEQERNGGTEDNGEKDGTGANDEKGGKENNQNNHHNGKGSHHACAYSNPGFRHMYKINVQTNQNRMADSLYVHLYESLEVMLESLKEDLECHQSEAGAHFISQMEMGRFIADFM